LKGLPEKKIAEAAKNLHARLEAFLGGQMSAKLMWHGIFDVSPNFDSYKEYLQTTLMTLRRLAMMISLDLLRRHFLRITIQDRLFTTPVDVALGAQVIANIRAKWPLVDPDDSTELVWVARAVIDYAEPDLADDVRHAFEISLHQSAKGYFEGRSVFDPILPVK